MNRFAQCHDGIISNEQDCPSGLIFDSQKAICALPDNVACPKEDYLGLRQPLLNYEKLDSSCAFEWRNGSVQFLNENKEITKEGICGAYGTCFEGELQVIGILCDFYHKF